MANQNLLTYNSKVTQVKQDFYAPVAIFPGTTSVVSTVYAFLAHVTPWDNDAVPPVPTQDQQNIKNIFKSMFVAKKITTNDISPVIERINWVSGTVYDYYQDNINMFAVNGSGFLIKKFYVKNKYDQVFKCLWNKNGIASTDEPFFQPGSYGNFNIYSGSDGYKWKYIYTLPIGSKQKFMDTIWMPIPVGANTIVASATTAKAGNIDVIGVVNGGSLYSPGTDPINVVITGDGTGATATAESTGGVITNIVVTNQGSNYTHATSTIVSANGSGAILTTPVSPIGGHGYDAMDELGCTKTMYTAEFNGSEGGLVPTSIDYRQVGLLINPVSLSSFPSPASGAIYQIATNITVASGFGVYVNDETVYQGSSLATATYSATVLDFNAATNIVRLINIVGTPKIDSQLFGNTSGTTRTLLFVNNPDFQIFSGYITYVENRSGIQRSTDGIEQFRFVLGY
jgi:hypothetical protein